MLDEVVATAVQNLVTTMQNCANGSDRIAFVPGACINLTNEYDQEDDEAVKLQKVVSWVVPIFFTIIGLAGLLGNALVVIGNFSAFFIVFCYDLTCALSLST